MARLAQGEGYNKGRIMRLRLKIRGSVQGVGFRPHLYHLAQRWNVTGWVLNAPDGVLAEVEGAEDAVEGFVTDLAERPPRLASINSIEEEQIEPVYSSDFRILETKREGERESSLPPDVATCDECFREIFNPKDRHWSYPFTNCTNCGPRYTIVRDVPYDRDQTSMAEFPMCEECRREYEDAGNRRFHAQPVACPKCGPKVELVDDGGRCLCSDDNWRDEFLNRIVRGDIIGVKGLGGFHLACDARSEAAVRRLRERKCRPYKPFAIMCRDVKSAERYCYLGPEERAKLESPEAPIVVLRKRPGAKLAEGLAPNLSTLGVMLPYTPLHHLLFDERIDVIVLTSGNTSGLPLVIDNDEAVRSLGSIADGFLWHWRKIENRCDDSVLSIVNGNTQFYRRSRGYVPRPIHLSRAGRDDSIAVLGSGSEMKNTFCLSDGKKAYVGPHMGDMGSKEGEEAYWGALERFSKIVGISPEVVAYDLHPGYTIGRIAQSLPISQKIGVQHHHAHIASCMAENGLTGPVIGVALDGTGYGADGRIWGFEVLVCDYHQFTREYHLENIPLPGGDKAAREPWRVATSYLYKYRGQDGVELAYRRFGEKEGQIEAIIRMIETGVNCPEASSAGRLFDAVSALLGICKENTYDGQAAIELEEKVIGADRPPEPYPFSMRGEMICPGSMWEEMIDDLASHGGVTLEGLLPEGLKGHIAKRFHDTVSEMVVKAVMEVSRKTGLNRVALSGGVFHNKYLFRQISSRLKFMEFEVYYHKQVPPNDGGISLGQAITALWRCDNVPCGSHEDNQIAR